MPKLPIDTGRSSRVEGQGPANIVKNNVAQCQIIWYKWAVDDDGIEFVSEDDFDSLSDTIAYDISEHLFDTCVFSKSRSAPFGTFSFRLDNSRDWKNDIRPGQWCLILMTQDGDLPISTSRETDTGFNLVNDGLKTAIKNNKLRGICYIESIQSATSIQENGSTDVYYEVSGRDFGVIYDETSLWFNSFKYDQLIVDNIFKATESAPRRSLDEFISIIHDFFFAPDQRTELQSGVAKEAGITDLARQWLLPRGMLQDLGLSVRGASFFGNIDGLKNFSESNFTIPVNKNIVSSLRGRAWEKINEFAITPHYHELFTETDDQGRPKLTYRQIPWSLDTKGYPSLRNNSVLYKEYVADPENTVEVIANDIFSMQVGNDNHDRYNHFLVTTDSDQTSFANSFTLIKDLTTAAGRQFPFEDFQSVRRHGFRPLHTSINSGTTAFSGAASNDRNNSRAGPDLLGQYNELILDFWRRDIFFESGSVEMSGNNRVKLGRVLDFGTDVPYNANKVFYIEEYTDTFVIGPLGDTEWRQTVSLVRGIAKEALNNDIVIPRRINEFKDAGSFNRDSNFGKRGSES